MEDFKDEDKTPSNLEKTYLNDNLEVCECESESDLPVDEEETIRELQNFIPSNNTQLIFTFKKCFFSFSRTAWDNLCFVKFGGLKLFLEIFFQPLEKIVHFIEDYIVSILYESQFYSALLYSSNFFQLMISCFDLTKDETFIDETIQLENGIEIKQFHISSLLHIFAQLLHFPKKSLLYSDDHSLHMMSSEFKNLYQNALDNDFQEFFNPNLFDQCINNFFILYQHLSENIVLRYLNLLLFYLFFFI